jgi:hypothetical protein
MKFGKWVPAFRIKSASSICRVFYHEYGDCSFLRNLVSIYLTWRGHAPEDRDLNIHNSDDLKSHVTELMAMRMCNVK